MIVTLCGYGGGTYGGGTYGGGVYGEGFGRSSNLFEALGRVLADFYAGPQSTVEF